MKRKVIKLNESDLRRIVNKIVKENINEGTIVGDISDFVFDKLITLVKKIGSMGNGKLKDKLKGNLEDELEKNDLDLNDLIGFDKKNKEEEKVYDKKSDSRFKGNKKNIIIGDSQVPYIDLNTERVSVLSNRPGESSLWSPGKNVSWLTRSISKFPESPEIKNVIISIGTNGGFGMSSRDDIVGLFDQLEDKFPSANYLIVQGSWGWGGNKNITQDIVDRYYSKFKKYGGIIIKPAIGETDDPHRNLKTYKEIGSNLDDRL